MAALRVGCWPQLADIGPQDPAQRTAFLGTLLLESPVMRLAVAIETGQVEHDWQHAAAILLQEAKEIARANTDTTDPFSNLPS